jgi:serine phosphatase RsbU (regulator of sigma subunit)
MDLYQQIFFTTLAITFCMLHTILFLYNRGLKSNLFFALFLFFYALNIFFDFQTSLSTIPYSEIIYLRIHRAVMPFNSVFVLLFLYTVFSLKYPLQFWIISGGLIVGGVLAVIEPIEYFGIIQIFLVILTIEITRVFTSAIYNRKEGAKVLAVGFIFLFSFSMYDLFMDIGLIDPIYGINNGYPFGFVFLIIFISIYLAREFANMNQKIITQEINQKLLEAEDARKSKELEEARKIQLSMLPDCLPDYKGLDVCFDMRTATEVGGDYYDYMVSEDGSITFVIGDATGHGMKAGLMVSIIKSLFITHINDMDMLQFLNKVSNAIRSMQFGNLFMSLMLVKVKDSVLTATSAGMPPLYIYRSKTKEIEEFVIKGMPLGAVKSFFYQKVETKLEKRDTVLLLSDGLTELFNEKNETFDDFRVKEIFKAVAELPSNEIAARLFKAGDEWRKVTSQKDDMTFVVFKST